jgi:hypothetical protein
VLCLGETRVAAQQQDQRPQRQGRGNFDPEEMRQRMMENYREQMGVKDDAEWKLIEQRIEKVNAARREAGTAAFGAGAFGAGRRGGRGPGGDGGGPRGGFRGASNPEVDALQKAISSNASADEIKQKLAKLREARKEKEAKLEQAQDDLRKVLSVRQEAVAVLNGLLK